MAVTVMFTIFITLLFHCCWRRRKKSENLMGAALQKGRDQKTCEQNVTSAVLTCLNMDFVCV